MDVLVQCTTMAAVTTCGSSNDYGTSVHMTNCHRLVGRGDSGSSTKRGARICTDSSAFEVVGVGANGWMLVSGLIMEIGS